MDSYKKEEPAPKPAAKHTELGKRASAGSGALHVDVFAPTNTASLRNTNASSTRRMASGPLEVEKTLGAMQTEVENGRIIVSKLEGRVAVLARAMRIIEKPLDVNQICLGISPGEANFTKQVAKLLQTDPGITRRVQVALYQFEQACKGLQQAGEVIEKAGEYDGPARGQYVDSHCHVEKLRGQLYPLINLHVVFKDSPLLAQLIPTPKASTEPLAAPPLPHPPVAAQAVRSPSGPLSTGSLASDPAVKEVVDAFNKVTGSLKDRIESFFGPKKET